MTTLDEFSPGDLLEMENNNPRVQRGNGSPVLKGCLMKFYANLAQIEWDDGTVSTIQLCELEVAG